MNELISSLRLYFNEELPKLKSSYQWKIPKIDGFPSCGESSYEANVELKKYLHSKWLASDDKEKLNLAKVIVSDWGGVKNNKLSTLASYLGGLHDTTPITPLKGIASYSKIYAIADMDRYAIYDARVAVCLNAIQLNAKVKKGFAFNYIPGRNNITGHAGKKIGFAYSNQFKVESLVKDGWCRVKKDNTYQVYIDTLNQCVRGFEEFSLYDLEMVLFSNAEKECIKAMESI